jgi:hypothetical protein
MPAAIENSKPDHCASDLSSSRPPLLIYSPDIILLVVVAFALYCRVHLPARLILFVKYRTGPCPR